MKYILYANPQVGLSLLHLLTFQTPIFSAFEMLKCVNDNLKDLYCSYNCLTSLPKFNDKLELINCSSNLLTSLPDLPDKLRILICFSNELTSLPQLIDKIQILHYLDNPIYDIMNNDNNDNNDNVVGDLIMNNTIHNVTNNISKDILKKIHILYKFKNLYYSLKFKKQFRDLLWVKVREPKIREKYSPENLKLLISNMQDHEDGEKFDRLLQEW